MIFTKMLLACLKPFYKLHLFFDRSENTVVAFASGILSIGFTVNYFVELFMSGSEWGGFWASLLITLAYIMVALLGISLAIGVSIFASRLLAFLTRPFYMLYDLFYVQVYHVHVDQPVPDSKESTTPLNSASSSTQEDYRQKACSSDDDIDIDELLRIRAETLKKRREEARLHEEQALREGTKMK